MRAGERVVAPDQVVAQEALERVVEAVHAAAHVQAVPPELISWQQPARGTAPVPVVNGLEAALYKALASQGLLHDTGFNLASTSSA